MQKKIKCRLPWQHEGRRNPKFLWEHTYSSDQMNLFLELERTKERYERNRQMARVYETVNLDRKSIGPIDERDPNVIQEFEGVYFSTRVTTREDGTTTYLHRVMDDKTGEEFELWGCDALDRYLVYFPDGTGIRLEYRRMIELPKNGQRYKDIRVQCEAGTRRLPEGQENIVNQHPDPLGEYPREQLPPVD